MVTVNLYFCLFVGIDFCSVKGVREDLLAPPIESIECFRVFEHFLKRKGVLEILGKNSLDL